MKAGFRKRFILFLIALALVCVAGVELVFCYFFDPSLFHTITAPVVDTVTDMASSVTATADKLARRINAAIREAEERRAQRELEAELEAQRQLEQAAEMSAPSGDATEEATENQVSTEPLIDSATLLNDPSVTHIETDGDRKLLTGGLIDVVYFDQSDKRWGELYYGTDKISTHGCGPTAMAMVVSSMTETYMDPLAMSQWAANHGHWARGSGSYHSIVMGIASDFGLEAEAFVSRDADDLREALLSGKLLVALMGPGHFTRGGHFIVLRGVTLTGDILVADPNSLGRSLVAWDAQLILDELSRSTASGSPLWLISAPNGGISQ